VSESDMRSKLVLALRELDAVAVENPACPGTPDIECTAGWIECKWVQEWPKREDTPVKLKHPLTPQQRVWLLRRTARGGLCWVMLQCRREWLLLRGDIAADHLGSVTVDRLRELAEWRCTRGLASQLLVEHLKAHR